MSEKLTHLDADGRVHMVDVGEKPQTRRVAVAEALVRTKPETLAMAEDAKKGDVRTTAEIAGIMAAKRTSELIPLCHALPLTSVKVAIVPDAAAPGFRVRAEIATLAQTGVEMEALMAASIACLTLYDMLKAVDRGMIIERVALVSKAGGASGDWRREDEC
jgi:cyclic pyranopterin phosphate synthase